MARIVVIGAGAIGASVAYHLAKLGADDVVLVDRGEIACGSTAKAMGGVRQQFSTAAEVILARDSIRFFEELGPPYFHQVGYLFLATSEEGLRVLEERRELQAGLGVPVESVEPRQIASMAPGVRVDDVHGGVFCAEDGVADPPSVTRELVRQAVEGGGAPRAHKRRRCRRGRARRRGGPYSANVGAALGVELPVRPLCRQLIKTKPSPSSPKRCRWCSRPRRASTSGGGTRVWSSR